jgi:hypothetical protein
MEAKLIKIDRNGSRHYEGAVVCDRCGGKGYYAIGVHNMQPVLSPHDGGVCWKCMGAGKVIGKWIERTPEYQAKLDARRHAKREAQRAAAEAEQAKFIAEREAREAAEQAEREAEAARIKAEKAISQHVGQIGERVEIKGTYVRTGSWEQKAYAGYGMTTMYCHTFKDADGNVFTWKTQRGICMNYGENVVVKGTVKAHSEYKDERQTELTRCTITAA